MHAGRGKWKGLMVTDALVCEWHTRLEHKHRGCRAEAVKRALTARGFEAGQYQGTVTTTAPSALLRELMRDHAAPEETTNGLRKGIAVQHTYERDNGGQPQQVRLIGKVDGVPTEGLVVVRLSERVVRSTIYGREMWNATPILGELLSGDAADWEPLPVQ